MMLLFMRRKKGLTLVEVMVTLAILGIVMSVLFSFLIFGNRTFNKDMTQYDIQSNTRLASDGLSDLLQYAVELELVDPPVSAIADDNLYNFIYFENNKIIHSMYVPGGLRRKVMLFDGPFTNTSYFEAISEYGITMNLEANDATSDYKIIKAVNLFNLKLKGKTINSFVAGAKKMAIQYK
jgi:prepilin-type N-terminal cleavage/methylation domain-containing protein